MYAPPLPGGEKMSNERREWLTIAEVVDRTGYNERYLRRLCNTVVKAPPENRKFRVDSTSSGYLIFWPSFLKYAQRK